MNSEDETPPLGIGEAIPHSDVPVEHTDTAASRPARSLPAGRLDALSPAIETPSVDAEAMTHPPHGFGKGVNDYLNHYVMIADAKAGAILAANLALGAALLDNKPSTAPGLVFSGALGMLALSSLICMIAVFPRLPGGGAGPIFWEDIRKRGSLAAYTRQVRSLDDDEVEREYASQNWHVSNLLHKKFRFVQWAIGTFGLGVALSCWWAWRV